MDYLEPDIDRWRPDIRSADLSVDISKLSFIWSLHMFFHEEHTALRPIRRQELIIQDAIAVLHLSEAKHMRM